MTTWPRSWSASWLASLPERSRRRFLGSLTRTEAEALLYHWEFWARPNQLPPPGNWRTWVLCMGRGAGKTRSAAEWVRAQVEGGRAGRIALVAATAADARDVMVEGPSGILAVCPPSSRPKYEPSKRRLTWPDGAVATTFSAEEPDRLRGPQHDAAWCDELCAWSYAEDTFAMLQFGLRLGENPQCVVTTTPRPVRLLKELMAAPTTAVTRGSTFENRANLAPAFLTEVIARYEGTRLGRQELNAEILEDCPGALWTRGLLEKSRTPRAPALKRVVVAVDPSASSGEGGAECGIVAAGLGQDGLGYVLEDRSLRASPGEWAAVAVACYRRWGADRLVAETNQGGAMVEATLRTVDRSVSFKAVSASRGKAARAEPVAALYEQGKVCHAGCFPRLEDQMCEWVPGEGASPDRLDALVWALTELMLPGTRPIHIY